MKEILKKLQERDAMLKKAIAKAEQEGAFPEGRLRINACANRLRFYHVIPGGDSMGCYITKDKKDLIGQLAQKDYNSKFLRIAARERRRVEEIIRLFSKENVDLLYEQMSTDRRKLITPYIITDDLYEKAWLAKPFRTNPYKPENKIYDTRRGEKVRSKSEAILANIFMELSIPYQYEKLVKLGSGRTAYPDFTLLHKRTREEIYFEHFGMLDDDVYRSEALHKLDEYRKSGIYPGRNLLFSYETEETPLDIKGIRDMLKWMFR